MPCASNPAGRRGPIVAIDWRGFGLTQRSGRDSYFFADYLADLDALLDELSPGVPVDLLGHSMGAMCRPCMQACAASACGAW